MMCKRHEGLMQNCKSENTITHETANRPQSNISKQAKTDKFQTKLTKLLIARNIEVRGNLTKLYINILNIMDVKCQINAPSTGCGEVKSPNYSKPVIAYC